MLTLQAFLLVVAFIIFAAGAGPYPWSTRATNLGLAILVIYALLGLSPRLLG